MNRRFLGLLGAVSVLGTLVLGVVFRHERGARAEFARQAELARADSTRIRGELLLYSKKRIAAGLTLSQTLAGMGAEPVLAANRILPARN